MTGIAVTFLDNTGTGTVSITTDGTNNINLFDNSVSTTTGLLTFTAGGALDVTSADAGQVQVDADGAVTISASGVGVSAVLDINGDGKIDFMEFFSIMKATFSANNLLKKEPERRQAQGCGQSRGPDRRQECVPAMGHQNG